MSWLQFLTLVQKRFGSLLVWSTQVRAKSTTRTQDIRSAEICICFPSALEELYSHFQIIWNSSFPRKTFFFFKVSVYERILKCSHSGSRKLNTFWWLVTVINFNLSPSISHRKYSYEWMLQQVHPNAKPLTGHVQLHQNSINDIADSTCLS